MNGWLKPLRAIWRACRKTDYLSPLTRDSPWNQLAFMTLTFAGKQLEHAHSVLILDESVDAILIVRSMLEGLCQLLWSAQEPGDRPKRWRVFAFVRDWRTMQKTIEVGGTVSPEERAYI